jgi:hypothetical protein
MTLEELRDNLNEVAGLVIADMVEHGETPAAPRFIGTLQINTGIPVGAKPCFTRIVLHIKRAKHGFAPTG